MSVKGQRAFLVLSGLFIAIILTEVLFRLGGFFFIQRIEGFHTPKKTGYNILCVGVSSTYGLGASDLGKFSYPMQLQSILEEKFPEKKFNVINAGIPGLNSSQLLNRLRKILSENKPHVMIIMIGINDTWNLEESNILKFYEEGFVDKATLHFALLLNRIRLYQFLKLVFISAEAGNPLYVPYNDATRSKGFEFSSDDSRRSQALYSGIKENITELLRISKDYHIKTLFMKYPSSGWGNPEKIIHEVYTKFEVPIVDNETVFNKATQMGMKVRTSDGFHPNNLGYLLIAKNIYNTMIAAKIIDGETIEMFSLGLNENSSGSRLAVNEIKFLDEMPEEGIGFYPWERWGGGQIPEWPEDLPVTFRWTGMRASMPPIRT
jgi:lysophospholipase L1-like esterase